MPGHILALKLIPLVFLAAAFVCMVLAFLWNRRRRRADWSERALSLQAPISTERKRVSLYLRHGAAAPDPDLAHLTVRVAEDLRRRLENPWYHAGLGLFVFGSALNLIINARDWGGSIGLVWFGFAMIAVVFWSAFYRRMSLERADRALAANRELAERYEPPEEGPAPPARER